jgi:O-antigen ligase
MQTPLLTTTLRWLLIVSVGLIPVAFDPLDPGITLLTAKLNLVWAVGVLALVLWGLHLAVRGRGSGPVLARVALPIGALAAALAIATWRSPNPHVALWGSALRGEGLVTFLCYLSVALVTAHVCRDSASVQRRWIAAALIGAAANALYALIQYAGVDPVWGFQSYLRPFGMQGNAVSLAGYLAMISVIAAVQIVRVGTTRARAGLVALLILLYAGLLVTGSRAGLAAFWGACGLAALATLRHVGRPGRSWLLGAAAALVVVSVLYASSRVPFARTIDEQALRRVIAEGGTLRTVPGELHPDARQLGGRLAMTLEYGGGIPVRLSVWRGAVRSWFRRPLLGQGLDTFRYFPDVSDAREARLYAGRELPPGFRYDRVHNEFLEMAVAAGLVGLLAFVWVLAALLRPAAHGAVHGGDSLSAAAAAGALAFLMVLQFQPGYLGASLVFWALLGFGVGRAQWVVAQARTGSSREPAGGA